MTDSYQNIEAKALSVAIVDALDANKAENIELLDVRKLTDVTDYMVIASGTSDRHVQAVARNMLDALAPQRIKPISVEGEDVKDWILVDFVDVVVHVMKRETRAFYDLESLWGERVANLKRDKKVKVEN